VGSRGGDGVPSGRAGQGVGRKKNHRRCRRRGRRRGRELDRKDHGVRPLRERWRGGEAGKLPVSTFCRETDKLRDRGGVHGPVGGGLRLKNIFSLMRGVSVGSIKRTAVVKEERLFQANPELNVETAKLHFGRTVGTSRMVWGGGGWLLGGGGGGCGVVNQGHVCNKARKRGETIGRKRDPCKETSEPAAVEYAGLRSKARRELTRPAGPGGQGRDPSNRGVDDGSEKSVKQNEKCTRLGAAAITRKRENVPYFLQIRTHPRQGSRRLLQDSREERASSIGADTQPFRPSQPLMSGAAGTRAPNVINGSSYTARAGRELPDRGIRQLSRDSRQETEAEHDGSDK